MIRFICFFLIAFSGAAAAQDRRPSHCIAMVQNAPGIQFLHKASYLDPVAEDKVRLRYVDHAMFLLQTQGGISIATDFTGFLGAVDFTPTVVTMNHAHGSHFTANPDPEIPHVLRGWGTNGVAADHHLDLGEVLIRNVPTDIRSRFGGDPERNGNSIFVFEVAGLCIGHLGHLHHEPSAQQYAALGRLDIVMAAVDGGLTVDHDTMVRILTRLRSSIIIPMHWFGEYNLEQFLTEMRRDFPVERLDGSSIEVSLATLPSRPTIMVLEPSFLRENE
ncbi:MBL fold metallo-hydrolase [Pseudaestuariivita rosea]|uniref:MBL fold metallo-hydrolase n=1 Tax=Pseudaestuariivita rosea TaxID=2763263 RepID=UPI001ABA3EB6|nr:MBL fold metallo-hydrolase [Pseudaestuariivita rosea]